MHTIHMTPEDWQEYFNQYPSPALEYLANLKSALESGWIDSTTADLRIKEIMIECREIGPVIESKEKEETTISKKQWNTPT